MGKMEDIGKDTAVDVDLQALNPCFDPPGGRLAAINEVSITGPVMRAAIQAIQGIQIRSPADVAEHGKLLAVFACDHEVTPEAFGGQALHARAIAMDRWCNRYDPFGQTDVDAFFEAGARAPLVETDEGMAFDAEAFAELIQFHAELPY